MKTATILLRIGVFGTFLGHGILAVMVNPSWIPYLEFWGFRLDMITVLMPIIGIIDILVAIITLLRPSQYVLIYAATWAFLTALVRPVTGQSWILFIERTANWAAPLALYFLLRYNSGAPKKTNHGV